MGVIKKEQIKNVELPNYDALCLVKNGIIEVLEGPQSGFGKQIINWQNGKPTHIEIQFTKKI
ncbi:MAG: DUF3954 domain-containing protein [Psychrobacillus psychrodurans]